MLLGVLALLRCCAARRPVAQSTDVLLRMEEDYVDLIGEQADESHPDAEGDRHAQGGLLNLRLDAQRTSFCKLTHAIIFARFIAQSK